MLTGGNRWRSRNRRRFRLPGRNRHPVRLRPAPPTSSAVPPAVPPPAPRRECPARRGRLALALAGGASGLAVSHLVVMVLMVRPIGRLAAAILITASLIVGVALGARTRHGRGRRKRRDYRDR